MARGGGGQAGLYNVREDIDRRDDDERRFDDRSDDSQRDQAFERALEQEMRQFEQDRAIDEILKAIINDPNMIMDDDGVIGRIDRPTKTTATRRARAIPISGRERIRRSGQFSRANILPPLSKPRKKNKKHCKNLSQCFRQANAKLRLKNGKLRKGKTQSDVAKMAHRLLKKMK
jgi:hypothetical protein